MYKYIGKRLKLSYSLSIKILTISHTLYIIQNTNYIWFIIQNFGISFNIEINVELIFNEDKLIW